MLEKIISYNGATITIRRATVRARLRTTLVYNKIGLPEAMGEDWLFMQAFARFITQATVEGDLGFRVPSLADDDETFLAGYEAFLNADVEFYDLVNAALLEVNRSPGDPDLEPGAESSKKKTT